MEMRRPIVVPGACSWVKFRGCMVDGEDEGVLGVKARGLLGQAPPWRLVWVVMRTQESGHRAVIVDGRAGTVACCRWIVLQPD